MTGEVLLFSYGTLRLAEVQRAQFGRELIGCDDGLPGYATRMVTISDPAVVALSGAAEHPMVVPSADPADVVAGVVFAVTPAELLAADAYEVDDYHRVEVTLASGRRAWVYMFRAS